MAGIMSFILPDSIATQLAEVFSAEIDFRRDLRVGDRFSVVYETATCRCPKALGTQVKRTEIMFHHEVTNQFLWNEF